MLQDLFTESLDSESFVTKVSEIKISLTDICAMNESHEGFFS